MARMIKTNSDRAFDRAWAEHGGRSVSLPEPGPTANYDEINQEGVNAIKKGAADDVKRLVGEKAVSKMVPPMGGNTRIRRDSKKYEALAGRVDNLESKASFKNGKQPKSRSHLDAGTKSGANRASEQVPYKARPGIQGRSEASPVLVQADGPEGFGPSYVGEGIDKVMPVNRELNAVERARQKNNRTRDMRTNLGRGKPSQPITDGE